LKNIVQVAVGDRAVSGTYRRAMPDELTLEVDGHQVVVTNPDKVFFPKAGITKAALVDYYLSVGEPLMRCMGGRPVLLERFPHGVGGKSFFQKRVPDSRPDWLRTTIVETPNGTTSRALVVADLAHVVWAVNLASLGFHVWPSRADDPVHADELRIDLDPTPGVTFEMVREAAFETRALLAELGISGFVKTTGSKGLHLYVSLRAEWSSYEVRAAAVALARELARRRPDLITDAWWKEERGTRVFVDFNQNAPHKTVFGAWSVRARVGAQVSTPVSWDDAATVMPDELTVDVVTRRVSTEGDPWAHRWDDRQDLSPLLELSAGDRASGLPDAPWPPVYPKMPDEPPRVAPSRARTAPEVAAAPVADEGGDEGD
jgi:DNA ligase D